MVSNDTPSAVRETPWMPQMGNVHLPTSAYQQAPKCSGFSVETINRHLWISPDWVIFTAQQLRVARAIFQMDQITLKDLFRCVRRNEDSSARSRCGRSSKPATWPRAQGPRSNAGTHGSGESHR